LHPISRINKHSLFGVYPYKGTEKEKVIPGMLNHLFNSIELMNTLYILEVLKSGGRFIICKAL
jgi:hypothetical protein